MRRIQALLGSTIFLILAPGTVAGLVPYLIDHWRFDPPFFGIDALRWVGVALVIFGLPVLIDSFLRFAIQGIGTPAPIVPTEHLVVSGLYRYVRNPMYLAVASLIFGQGLLFGDSTVIAYGALVCVAFHLFVCYYEEPTLRRTFGQEYATYCARVPRWIPRPQSPEGAKAQS